MALAKRFAGCVCPPSPSEGLHSCAKCVCMYYRCKKNWYNVPSTEFWGRWCWFTRGIPLLVFDFCYRLLLIITVSGWGYFHGNKRPEIKTNGSLVLVFAASWPRPRILCEEFFIHRHSPHAFVTTLFQFISLQFMLVSITQSWRDSSQSFTLEPAFHLSCRGCSARLRR